MEVRTGTKMVSTKVRAAPSSYGQSNTHISTALRVEFLKMRARALRYAEEVQLLQEEQRRVLQSLHRTALIWEQRGRLAEAKECTILREGAVAYAARQHCLFTQLVLHFSQAWTNFGLANENGDNPSNAPLDDKDLFTIAPDDDDDENGLMVLKSLDDDEED